MNKKYGYKYFTQEELDKNFKIRRENGEFHSGLIK